MTGVDLGIKSAHILFFGEAVFEDLAQRFVRSSERSDIFSDLGTRSLGQCTRLRFELVTEQEKILRSVAQLTTSPRANRFARTHFL